MRSFTEIEKIDRIIDSYVTRLFSNRKFHRIIHQELMLNEREVLQDADCKSSFSKQLCLSETLLTPELKKERLKKLIACLL